MKTSPVLRLFILFLLLAISPLTFNSASAESLQTRPSLLTNGHWVSPVQKEVLASPLADYGDVVVSDVTASNLDGYYNANKVIHVQVVFSAAVDVTGTPQIILRTGTSATTTVNFVSAFDPQTLVFDYTVAAGDTAPDLDYDNTGALQLNDGTIKDTLGNDVNLGLAAPGTTHSLGLNKAIVIDTTDPTVSFDLETTSDTGVSSTDDITRAASPIIDANFSEAIATLDSGDFSNTGTATGCSISVGTPSGDSYPVTLSGCSEGTIILQIAAGAVKDLAGNEIALTGGPTITIDQTAPTMSFDLAAGSDTGPNDTDNITNAASLSINAIFNEEINGWSLSDVTHTGTSTCTLALNGNTANTYHLTGSPCGEGTLILHLAAGGVTDIAGNGNALTDGPSITIDRTAPALVIDLLETDDTGVSATDNITRADPLSIDLIFNEQVDGWTLGDITHTGTSTCTLASDGATGNTFHLAAWPCGEGTLILHMAAASVTDLAGNPNILTDGPSILIDRTAPTVTLDLQTASDTGTSTTDNITKAAPLNFDAIFNEAISGFGTDDLSAAGSAAPCSFSLNGNTGNTYHFSASGCADGSLLVSLAAGAVTDPAGNTTLAAASPSVTIDRTAPTGTFDLVNTSDTGNSDSDNITNAASLPIDLSFDEPVSGLVIGDITHTGTSVCTVTLGGNTGNIYHLSGSPCTEGTLTVHLPAASVTDTAGNDNLLADGPIITIDRTGPVATFDLQDLYDTGTSATDNITKSDALPIDVTFNEEIFGWELTDVTHTGTATCTLALAGSAGNTYHVNAYPCTEGTLILHLTAGGVTDIAGNPNLLKDGPTITIDRTAPSMSFDLLTASDTGPSTTDNITNAASLSIDAIFLEPISGWDLTDISNTGTSTCTLALNGSTGNTYHLTGSPCGAGTLLLHLAASGVTDVAGNVNELTDGPTITIDRTAPTLTFDLLDSSDTGTSGIDNITNAASLSIDMNFDEDISGLALGDITRTGTAASCTLALGGNTGTAYHLTASPCAEGTVILHLTAGSVTDLAGNPIILTNGPTITIDRTAPTVVFDLLDAADTGSSSTDNITNAASLGFTAAFNEPISNLIDGNLSNAGLATGCGFSVGVPTGNTYPFTVTDCSENTLIVRLAASGLTDLAGNPNLQADGPTVTIDRTVPTVLLTLQPTSDTGTSNSDNITRAAPLIFNAAFNEAISGLDTGDFMNDGGTATLCAFSIGVKTVNTYPITASTCTEGTLILRINSGGVMDIAGNLISLTDSPSIKIDRTAPGLTFDLRSSSDTGILPTDNITSEDPLVFDAMFTEDISGFVATDLTFSGVTGCALTVGIPDVNSYPVTASGCGEGTLALQLTATSVTDPAGNTNLLTNSPNVTIDRTAPTVTVTSSAADPTSVNPIPATITFNEVVYGFTVDEIIPTHGTINNFQIINGSIYSVDVIPTVVGLISVDIYSLSATDAAGNGNAAAATFSITYDSEKPLVSMASTAPIDTNVAVIPVTVTFSKPVLEFVAGDITPFNGTVSNFHVTSTTVYTFDLTASSQGLVKADIAAGVAHDAAGNLNTAAPTFSRTYDSIAPTVTITLKSTSDSGSSSADNITNVTSPVFDVVFSEAVTGFTGDDSTNAGGTASGCTFSVGIPTLNTYPLTAYDCTSGTLIARLATGSLTDLAGNPLAQTDSTTITIDRVAPSVSFDLQSASDSGISFTDNITNAASLSIDAIFLEPISGWDLTDISNTGTSTCTLALHGSTGNTYHLTGSPCGEGTLLLHLAASSVTDVAGNVNELTDGPTITIDRTAPVFSKVQNQAEIKPATNEFINSITIASDVSYKVDEVLNNGSITMMRTGGSADATAHTCTLKGAALQSGDHANLNMADTTNACTQAQSLVNGSVYTFNFQGADAAGNNATVITNSNITFDTTPPTIQISAPSVPSAAGGQVTYTVTYADTNFNVSSLTVANITINKACPFLNDCPSATLGVSGGTAPTRTITLNVAPTGNGTLGLTLAAGTASDKAGNLAPGITSGTFIVDHAHPTVNWISPTGDEGYYTVYNPLVHLEVDAHDTMGISRVVFKRFDNIGTEIIIGTITQPPYQLDFDATNLFPGNNDIYAYAYDVSGNLYYKYIWLFHPPTLSIHKTGPGNGRIVSTPAGVNCGTTCGYGFDVNTIVNLTATPNPGSIFTGWSGACNGTGTCIVTMGADHSVTANFISLNIIYLPLIIKQ